MHTCESQPVESIQLHFSQTKVWFRKPNHIRSMWCVWAIFAPNALITTRMEHYWRNLRLQHHSHRSTKTFQVNFRLSINTNTQIVTNYTNKVKVYSQMPNFTSFSDFTAVVNERKTIAWGKCVTFFSYQTEIYRVCLASLFCAKCYFDFFAIRSSKGRKETIVTVKR